MAKDFYTTKWAKSNSERAPIEKPQWYLNQALVDIQLAFKSKSVEEAEWKKEKLKQNASSDVWKCLLHIFLLFKV